MGFLFFSPLMDVFPRVFPCQRRFRIFKNAIFFFLFLFYKNVFVFPSETVGYPAWCLVFQMFVSSTSVGSSGMVFLQGNGVGAHECLGLWEWCSERVCPIVNSQAWCLFFKPLCSLKVLDVRNGVCSQEQF